MQQLYKRRARYMTRSVTELPKVPEKKTFIILRMKLLKVDEKQARSQSYHATKSF